MIMWLLMWIVCLVYYAVIIVLYGWIAYHIVGAIAFAVRDLWRRRSARRARELNDAYNDGARDAMRDMDYRS